MSNGSAYDLLNPELKRILDSITKKHRVFLSYYHNDDEYYRKRFEQLFGDLYLSHSVEPGEIDSDNSDEYIKKVIQQDCISSASVVIVLVGARTYGRKHVDWEISAGLNKKVGGYSGLIGLCLPTNPDYVKENYDSAITPSRLVDNLKTGYAKYYNWSEDSTTIKKNIAEAFEARISRLNLIDNSRIQMQRNLFL